MSRPVDWSDVGVLALQDHDEAALISLRQQMVGARISLLDKGGDDDGLTAWAKDDDDKGTLGDLHPWRFWQTEDREQRYAGSWSYAFAAIIGSAESGAVTTPSEQAGARPGGAVAPGTGNRKAPKPSGKPYAYPIKDNKTFADTRYKNVEHEWLKALPGLPKGTLMIAMSGTDEREQQDILLHADPRLIAVNVGGPPDMGTIVCDLQPDGEIAMGGAGAVAGVTGRTARLQSMMRVVPLANGGSPTGVPQPGGNALAWQLAASGAGDFLFGYGFVFGEGDTATPAVTTPGGEGGDLTTGGDDGGADAIEEGGLGNPYQGQGATDADRRASEAADLAGGPTAVLVGPRPRGDRSRGSGVAPTASFNIETGKFERSKGRASYVAAFAARRPAYGPLELGHAKADKHRTGYTKDKQATNSLHISTDALFYKNIERDGPLEFSPWTYPKPGPLPGASRVWLTWDASDVHPWVGGERDGKWRWYAEVPYVGGDGPPGEPTEPDEPRRPDRPRTPGEQPPPPPGDITPPDPPPVTGGGDPIPGQQQGPDDFGVPYAPGFGPDDGSQQGPDDFGVPYAPGFGPPPRRGGGGGSAPADGGEGTVSYGARKPAYGKPEVVGVIDAEYTDALFLVHHPMLESFASVAWRPQLEYDGFIDFRHNPQVNRSLLTADERVRPQVVAQHAWGASADGDWDYTLKPNRSRARGGIVGGGIVYTPPNVMLKHLLDGEQGTDAHDGASLVQGYVGVANGVSFFLGRPMRDGGIDAGSYTIKRNTGSGNFEVNVLDSARAEQPVYGAAVDQASGERVTTLGGKQAARLPVGTTGERPAVLGPLAGQARFNSTLGAAEVYNGASWVTLGAGSAIAVTTYAVAGAGAHTWNALTRTAYIIMVGGGGGGGGVAAPAAGASACAGGGSSGAVLEHFYAAGTLPASPVALVVGAGGGGGAAGGGAGIAGGASTFNGGVLTAAAGAGGGFVAAAAAPAYALGGLVNVSAGGNVLNGASNPGEVGAKVAAAVATGGMGGCSRFGGGGQGVVGNAAGNNGLAAGAGGGGASSIAAGPAAAGGNGVDGCIIVLEFA